MLLFTSIFPLYPQESSQGFASQIPLQAINTATFSQEYHNLLGKAVNRGSKALSGRVDHCNSGPKHLRIGLACCLVSIPFLRIIPKCLRHLVG